jgi:hypothetical protein
MLNATTGLASLLSFGHPHDRYRHRAQTGANKKRVLA